MNRIQPVIYALLLIAVLYGCARISTPRGGPEDKTPPTLIASVPDSAQINYHGNTVLVEFDEWVKTNNIESNLIITPSIEGGFKTKVNKTSVMLTFLKPLKDSTTYTLNFGNTIQDITNNNVPRNLRLSFSTGPYIDSLQISGKVLDLYRQDPKENTLISLYESTDTLDITTGPASYFTRTDTAGNYIFTNLPANRYLVYAAFDKNNNLKAETEEELYGFFVDTLDLVNNISNIDFTIQRLNTKPLRSSGSRTFGKYFDISFNKPIIDFELQPIDTSKTISYFHNNPDNIRLYNWNQQYADTSELIVTARDSLQIEVIDTVQYYFIESKIKADPFSFQILPTTNDLQSDASFNFKFTKPVKTFIQDSLYYQLDSVNLITMPDSILTWNESRTELSWPSNLDRYIQQGQTLDLVVRPGAFISVESDSTQQRLKRVKIPVYEETGLITGTITTDAPNFIIQLLNSSDLQVISEITNQSQFTFSYVNPGTYFLRLILDTNANGKWDTGNILTRTPPEPAKYFFDSFNKTKQIKLRKNWENTDINISFTVDNQ